MVLLDRQRLEKLSSAGTAHIIRCTIIYYILKMLFSVPPDYQTTTNRKKTGRNSTLQASISGRSVWIWDILSLWIMQTNIRSSHTSINTQTFAWHRSGCCFEKGCWMKSVKPRRQDRMVVWVFIGILHIGVIHISVYLHVKYWWGYIHDIFHWLGHFSVTVIRLSWEFP